MKRRPDGTPRRRGLAKEEHVVIEVSEDGKRKTHKGDFDDKPTAERIARKLGRKSNHGSRFVAVHADTWNDGEWSEVRS